VTLPDPGGEWRILGPLLDNTTGMTEPATPRLAGSSVTARTNPRNRRLSSAELNVESTLLQQRVCEQVGFVVHD
jgi:hypothetical protein